MLPFWYCEKMTGEGLVLAVFLACCVKIFLILSDSKYIFLYIYILLTYMKYLKIDELIRNNQEWIDEKLKEDNYQSDFRYGEMLLRSRISKQSGPNNIKMELAAKGISDSLIEIILSNVECDWNELALLAAEKKYKPLKEESTYEEKKSEVEVDTKSCDRALSNAVF